MSSEPPEEPHLRSEPNTLSPASPKPIHFPAPANIPVLEMQTDVSFNQTELHMSDPATRNTELRPDAWRDPAEQAAASDGNAGQSSLEAAGGDATQPTGEAGETSGGSGAAAASEINMTDMTDTAVTNEIADASDPVPISTSQSDGARELDLHPPPELLQPSSDPTFPSAPDADPSNPTDSQNPPLETGERDRVHDAQSINNSAVDVQALLNTLVPPPGVPNGAETSNANVTPSVHDPAQAQDPNATEPTSVEDASQATSGLAAQPTGLPPRPPPQEQPIIHPNYVHSQHIRDYHPHANNPAFQPHTRSGSSSGQGNVADPNARNYVPPVHSPSNASASQAQPPQESSNSTYPSNITVPSNTQGVNGSQQSPPPGIGGGGVPAYTPTAADVQGAGYGANPQNVYGGHQYPAPSGTPGDGRQDRPYREGEQPRPEDRPWDAEVQRKYDRFIEDERRYVSEGRWEQFPQGSRLFVGNLSSEKVTKRDIFHVFHTYGDLAQISIKQAYGFVQFLRTEDCMRALQMEQGTQIRDKKIHLEVSKPQKNRTQNPPRRSRSPPDAGRGRPGANVDRYVSGSRGGNNRGSYRSPSPRGYRDRYDDRSRRRSRTPDYSRGSRYRSPSPRRDLDDDLPLPRRAPRDVPDVQIVVIDSLDRDFISWVEQAFSSRAIRVDVLLLSPRLSEQAVVRRQIVEGVAAVVKLSRQNQNTGKIGLQIFDRSAGANNVKFEEYEGLDPNVAAQLVLRAKGAGAYNSAPPNQSYTGYGAQQPQQQYGAPPPQHQQYGNYGAPPPSGQPPYGQQQQPVGYPPQHQPPYGAPPPNLIPNLDPNNLQNLLSAMKGPQPSHSTPPAGGMYGQQQQPGNPGLGGYLPQQPPQQPLQQGRPQSGGAPAAAGAQVNMQDILARLGTGQR